MKGYYFDNVADVNGNHVIHAEDSAFIPPTSDRTYIGDFSSCNEALQRAKALYPEDSFVCCPLCP